MEDEKITVADVAEAIMEVGFEQVEGKAIWVRPTPGALYRTEVSFGAQTIRVRLFRGPELVDIWDVRTNDRKTLTAMETELRGLTA